MREVQATEAKTHLAQLLSAVERGESIAITRHGKPVAHLVPAEKQDRAARKAAIERFKAWRETWKRPLKSFSPLATKGTAIEHLGH